MSRRILLATTLATTLATGLVLPAARTAQAAAHQARQQTNRQEPSAPAAPGDAGRRAGSPATNPFDEVERLAKAPKATAHPAPAPGGITDRGRIPGPQTPKKPRNAAPHACPP
ncbi:hypothetical protein [Streptomyces sp. NPDC051776]|uniref:hypothetical protein n=1 Tax=Streptomyces sp. NPDC051776 TaxID=3155414 RepID=UPI003440E88B